MALLPVDEALRRILDGVTPTGAETVPIMEADGRVLAEDLGAKLTQPPFDASAMDGYALRAGDAGALPARLKVAGQSAAGARAKVPLGAGEAVRIFTGAPVPEGADTVVLQENTEREGDIVVIREGVSAGANIRARGIDFEEGQTLLHAGERLDAPRLMLAAAMGWGSLPVRRRPVVAILATGDELVPPGTVPGRDQIVSANPVGLAALVTRLGGVARPLGIAGDKLAAIDKKIADAADADVLLTIGGASVGDHDLVGAALKARGMALAFWKVAMRPGKPLLFGHLGTTRVLGLPGNPVSAYVCAYVFLRPLIYALLGRPATTEDREIARLTEPLGANGPRLHLMRGKLSTAADGTLAVTALPSQDSSLMSALACADCLIVRGVGAEPLPAGASVEIERLMLGD